MSLLAALIDRRAQPIAVAVVRSLGPGRRLHHRGQDEPGYRNWYARLAGARVARHQLQPLSGHLRRRRDRPDLAAAAHRHVLAAVRRAAVRGAAGDRMAEHRPDAALHPRLCDPGGRAGRAGVGLSQPGSERLRRRRAGKRPQALFGDRHGAAAADHPRGADAGLVRGARAARPPIMASGSASTPSFASTSTRPSIARWGADPGSATCPPIIHAEDYGTVFQPPPQPAPRGSRSSLRRRRLIRWPRLPAADAVPPSLSDAGFPLCCGRRNPISPASEGKAGWIWRD